MEEKNQKAYELLKYFLDKEGVSGFESYFSKENNIVEAFKTKVKEFNKDVEISRDGFGSVIAKLGNKPDLKVMFCAHMDEVGFVVQRIEKDGFIRISNLGNQWVHTLLAKPVKVITTEKKEFYGVIGSTNVHVLPAEERTKVMKLSDIYVDLGFSSEKEVRDAGIDVGDPIVKISHTRLLGDKDKFMGRAVDNRMSVAIIAQIIKNLKGKQIPNESYFVATAQEEILSMGAKGSTQQIQPHVAIAIDTTSSHDVPGIIPGDTKLGKGVALTIKDSVAIANPELTKFLFELAKKHKIPTYKFVSQGGANDSEVTQYSRGGIPVITIAIPARYLHTPNEVGSIKDFNAVVDLMTEFVKSFDHEAYQKTVYK